MDSAGPASVARITGPYEPTNAEVYSVQRPKGSVGNRA